jgi:hypothetical protein
MKTKLFIIAVFLLFSTNLFAQFDKPVLQVGLGLVEPYSDMKGTYYRNVQVGTGGYFLLAPDTNLITNNYGAKTGLYFYGKGKINFDKYNITRAVASVSFSTFNSFEPTKKGFIGIPVRNINNEIDTFLSSAEFNYTFNNFSFGIGLEVSPLAFTNVLSPYFGANVTFNTFNANLTRTENRIDTNSISFTEFRIGANFDAGIEAKFSKKFGMVLGVKFDLGNLLLRSTSSGLADRIEWGKSNAFLNDDEGYFFSSMYSPVISSINEMYTSKKKNINWGTIYIGVNIYFEKDKTTKKKTDKK